MDDLISVVIPVYKVEKFLDRCLNSVINQNYKNIEIILIDDGSPDNCGEICDSYAERDNRIKVIHKSNGGLSSARNVGIEASNGKYITFIDSDDVISFNYISSLYNNLVKTRSEISICGYQFVGETEIPDLVEDISGKIEIFDSKKALELMLYQKKINNSAWGKLYLKTIFDDIKYPEGKIYEDIATTYKTFLKSNTICIDTAKYYFYTRRNDSISCSFNEKTFDIIENVRLMEEDLLKYPRFKKPCNSRVLNAEFFLIRQLDKKSNFEMYNFIIKDIRKRRLSVLLDYRTRFKTKMGIMISFVGIDLLKKIYQIGKKYNFVIKLD